MPICTIMRGLSGSGKSHWVLRNRPNARVASADRFWYHIGKGKYQFEVSRQGEAHEFCRRIFQQALADAANVVIDNVNAAIWQYANYYWLAELFNYGVEIIEMHCKTQDRAELCVERSQHGVPLETVIRWYSTWEPDTRATLVPIQF